MGHIKTWSCHDKMGHIKTSKALHLTEILTLLKSFETATFDQQKTNVFFVFQNQVILRPRLSNLSATPSENHIVWAYLSWLCGKQIQQTLARDNPGLYGISRAVWGFIAWLKFLYGQSVRFPASFPCLSFPVPFLYIARTKAVLTGLKAY